MSRPENMTPDEAEIWQRMEQHGEELVRDMGAAMMQAERLPEWMASPKGGNYNTALREAQQMANNGYDMAQITEYLIRKNYSDSTISQVSQTMGW